MAEPNLIDQLAEFNRRTGKPFIDPTRITGFGENDPPPPPLKQEAIEIPSAKDIFGEPAEQEVPTSASPRYEAPAKPAPIQAQEELVILESAATYKGLAVSLSESERALVCAIVLRAVKRSMKEKYRELEGLLPKRRKRRSDAGKKRKKVAS